MNKLMQDKRIVSALIGAVIGFAVVNFILNKRNTGSNIAIKPRTVAIKPTPQKTLPSVPSPPTIPTTPTMPTMPTQPSLPNANQPVNAPSMPTTTANEQPNTAHQTPIPGVKPPVNNNTSTSVSTKKKKEICYPVHHSVHHPVHHPVYHPQPKPQPKPKENYSFESVARKLQNMAVVCKANQSCNLSNSYETLHEGDAIDGYKITKITLWSVDIEKDGKVRSVSLR